MSGIFISVEGIDGSGKSTLCRSLAKALENQGRRVYLTREPGSINKTGFARDAIRKLLLEKNGELTAVSQLFLYAADRNLHYELEIKPALERGELVLSDRHLDSSLAYQSTQSNVSFDKVLQVQNLATFDNYPDLTIYLDLPVEIALQRTDARGTRDRMEDKGLDYLNEVAQNYQKILKHKPFSKRQFVTIDATQKPDAILKAALEAINIFLKS